MVMSAPEEPNQPEQSTRHDPARDAREPIPIESARRSRLDREVDEILSQATRDAPLPPTPISSRRRKPAQGPTLGDRIRVAASTLLDVLLTVPLITAVAFGIVCAVVAPYSRLLAMLFAVLAVAVLIVPYVQQARRSSLPGGDPKMWRGRIMDPLPPSRRIGERSAADKISDWINSRRS